MRQKPGKEEVLMDFINENKGDNTPNNLKVVRPRIPCPEEAWAQVELYRWQYGCLPRDNRPIHVPTALRNMAAALVTEEPPAPGNVASVLAYVATQLEAGPTKNQKKRSRRKR